MRRTACHRMAFFHRSGTRVGLLALAPLNFQVQFGRVGERINKMMGLVDSVPTMDVVSPHAFFFHLLTL